MAVDVGNVGALKLTSGDTVNPLPLARPEAHGNRVWVQQHEWSQRISHRQAQQNCLRIISFVVTPLQSFQYIATASACAA